nr:MAG TPA: Mnd1 HTH domain [Caudoviricetes sp.]
MQNTANEAPEGKRGELQDLIIAELRIEGGLTISVLRGRVMARSGLQRQQVTSAIQYMGQTGQLPRVKGGNSFRYWAPGEKPFEVNRDPDRQVVRRKFSLPPNMNHEVMSPLQWSLRHLLGQTN